MMTIQNVKPGGREVLRTRRKRVFWVPVEAQPRGRAPLFWAADNT